MTEKSKNSKVKKKKIFFSDIDGTLIFSAKKLYDKSNVKNKENEKIKSAFSSDNEHIIIENKDGKPLTYTTPYIFNLIQLMTKDIEENKSRNCEIIPVTCRSKEQLQRMFILFKNIPKYIVCDNGASIYINGEKDMHYDDFINSIIRKKDIKEIYKKLAKISNEDLKSNNLKIRNSEDSMIVVVYSNQENAKKELHAIREVVNESPHKYMYKIIITGRKVYIVPKYLDKKVAVEYILRKIEKENLQNRENEEHEEYIKNNQIITIGAGNDVFDKDMINMCDISLNLEGKDSNEVTNIFHEVFKEEYY